MQDKVANGQNASSERPTPVWPLLPSRPARLGRGARAAIAVAVVCALLALALSAALAVSLWRAARTTATVLDASLAQLDGLCGPGAQPLTYTFSQTIRFQGDIAMPEGMVFPFKGNFPINTVVRLKVPGLPGSPEIAIPINTTVPVDTAVPIPGGMTIPVDTEIPVHQTIPIDVCGGGGDLAAFLQRTTASLRSLRAQLP